MSQLPSSSIPFFSSSSLTKIPKRFGRLFVLIASFYLASCAKLSWSHSAFESTLNSSIVSYPLSVLFLIPDLDQLIHYLGRHSLQSLCLSVHSDDTSDVTIQFKWLRNIHGYIHGYPYPRQPCCRCSEARHPVPTLPVAGVVFLFSLFITTLNCVYVRVGVTYVRGSSRILNSKTQCQQTAACRDAATMKSTNVETKIKIRSFSPSINMRQHFPCWALGSVVLLNRLLERRIALSISTISFQYDAIYYITVKSHMYLASSGTC